MRQLSDVLVMCKELMVREVFTGLVWSSCTIAMATVCTINIYSSNGQMGQSI